MASVLFLIADYYSSEKSVAKNVATTFLRQYIEENPKDEVRVRNLCEYPFVKVDRPILDAWEKLLDGVAFDQLAEVQQKKLSQIDDLSAEFFETDKFVIVAPNWNYNAPPQLAEYFLSILRLGTLFSIDEEQLPKLMDGAQKKVFMITSSLHCSSDPTLPHYNVGVDWVKRIFSLCGVPDFEVMYIEGMADQPEKRDELLKNANVDAKIFAATF